MLDILTVMPNPILLVAKQEALQYVLDDVDEEVKPVITAAFWGIGKHSIVHNHGMKFLLKVEIFSIINFWTKQVPFRHRMRSMV